MKNRKLFFSLIKESIKISPGNYIALAAGTAISSLSAVLSAFFLALMLDALMNQKTFEKMLCYVALYCAALCLAGVSKRAVSLYSTATGYKASNVATLKLQQKAIKIPYHVWDSSKHYGRLRQAVNSSWVFQNIADLTCENMLGGILTLFPTVYIIGRVHVVLLVVLVSLVLLEMRLEEKYDQKQYDLEETITHLGKKTAYDEKVLTEFKFGKEVRLFDMKDGLLARYCSDKQAENKVRLERSRLACRFSVISLSFTMLESLLVYSFAVVKSMNGEINVADFFTYVGAVLLLVDSVKQIVWSKDGIKEILNYYKNYYEFMREDYTVSKLSQQKAEQEKMSSPLLSLNHVSYRYEEQEKNTLDDICLDICEGEKVAVVGENGAGKSTLMKVLLNLYQNYTGEIYYKGRNIRTMEQEGYAKILSAVFQDYFLHAFSIRENIVFDKEEEEQTIYEFLEKMELKEKVSSMKYGLNTLYSKELSEEGVELSGGEGQKLATVRGLYKNSKLLVLDESTAAMDPISESNYYDVLMKDKEKAMIFITHRMASTKKADKIVVIDHGKIVEQGSFEELYKRGGLFYSMFSKQAELYAEQTKKEMVCDS